ncbi:MAG: sugar transferase [Gemmatimonadales bacterium]|nr:sugar transferase [Gemmatimonadales bacterium]
MSDSRARVIQDEGNLTLLAGGFHSSQAGTAEKIVHDEPERMEFPLLLPGKIYLGIKRVLDFVIALGALAVFGLLLPVISLIIKLDSPGPVFYSQDRVGLNRRSTPRGGKGVDRRKIFQPGRPFQVHKLRTMSVNAEANGPQLAAAHDCRITRVGRFLRQTRIDEIPQFWNILKGEMSLIGPRPERLVFVRQLEKEIPNYKDRLFVLPGITGLAQVLNGYDENLESVKRKVRLDREYIRKSGFRQDGKILCSTVGVVIKGEGAR